MQTQDTPKYSSVELRFEVDYPNAFRHGDNLTVLLESMKTTYVLGEQSVELFEEQIDAWLRYSHRIEWRPYHANLELRGEELNAYPRIIEWVDA